MAGKYFGIPFALSGDRTAIPDAAQPDGSVSFTQGFTLDYELENTDPNYKPVPREETNALYYDITEAIGIVQKQGFADWTIAAAPYPINAFVRHNDIVWRNTVAGNSAEPGTDATWANETIPATDYLNTQRIDVASASTVDLTALAPDTRHINITGTAAITGFTVAAGQCYFVRFAGALTLTNSASIATQSGANITTQAGDTCIIRATSSNVVEVLSYEPAGGWARSFSNNGYQKLPSGLIIQWGTLVAAAGGTTLVTFPITFPNNALWIVGGITADFNIATNDAEVSFYSPTTTGATAKSSYGSAMQTSYLVIGN